MRLTLFVYLLLLSSFSQAQETTPSFTIPRAVAKIAPLYFFNNTLDLGVEVFNSKFTKSFNASVGLRSGGINYVDGKGLGIEVGYRKYVSPMKLHTRKTKEFYQGIYYSLFFRGDYFKGTENNYYYDYNSGNQYSGFTRKTNSIGPGFTIGLEKTFWEIIFIDFYIGGGIKFSDVEISGNPMNSYYRDYDIMDPGYEGIYPKIGAKIGVGL
jgi:hypothetical protein